MCLHILRVFDAGGSVLIFCKSGAHRAPFMAAIFMLYTTGKSPQEVYELLTSMRPIVERIFLPEMDILQRLLKTMREPRLYFPRLAKSKQYERFWMVSPDLSEVSALGMPRPDLFVCRGS